MLTALLTLLVLALVLYVVYLFAGIFIQGKPLMIIGLILGLIFLVYALKALGISLPGIN